MVLWVFLNNLGSWQPVGVSKNYFYLPFWHKSFILDDVKFAELSNNIFEWKNVTSFFFGGGRGSQNILWPLLPIFRGQDLPARGSTPRALTQSVVLCVGILLPPVQWEWSKAWTSPGWLAGGGTRRQRWRIQRRRPAARSTETASRTAAATSTSQTATTKRKSVKCTASQWLKWGGRGGGLSPLFPFEKKKISHRHWGPLRGSSTPFLALGAGES